MALAPAQATLAKRLAAAKSRITTTARATIETSAAEPKTTPKPAPPANAKAKSPAHETKNQADNDKAKAAKGKGKRGRATGDRGIAAAPASEIAAALRAAASNAPMAALVSDDQLVGVWQAIVDGAARLGPAGAADRAALGRAIGLPIHQYAGGGGRGPGAKVTGAEIAGRLETALERSRRRVPVTDTAGSDENDVETAA